MDKQHQQVSLGLGHAAIEMMDESMGLINNMGNGLAASPRNEIQLRVKKERKMTGQSSQLR